MNPSTHKKVLLRLRALPNAADEMSLGAGFATGFINPAQLDPALRHAALDLLTPEGLALSLDPATLQAVFFLSSFEAAASLRSNTHVGRSGPRLPGLWVRLRGRDHQNLEGILATDLLDLASGITLSPLYRDSLWQRIFVPRAAVEQITPIEMIRPPRRRRPSAPLAADAPRQFGLFSTEAPFETIEATREGPQ